ncbi:MAG: hypothetical protein HN719_00090 [Alphaproteobacteria bacterium]|nr:hypothetical protein [Alphaproteobacteria bacterium]
MTVYVPCVTNKADAVKVTIYHDGFLAEDRETDVALDAMATGLWERANRDEIQLFQQRSGKNSWHYFYVETTT